MDQPGNFAENLSIGMKVEINPQRDKSRKELVEGVITKILTRSPQHPHGILVEVQSGETGRVKNIINSPKLTNSHTEEPEEKETSQQDLNLLITNGENHFVEFKSSILWSLNFSTQQLQESQSYELRNYGVNASKFIIAKSLASFLNADGGHLIIGIKENKSSKQDEVIGIESEFHKLSDQCLDGYRRMIVDTVIRNYFPSNIFHHFNNYLTINFEQIEGKTVCHIHIKKSDSKVFITSKKNKKYGHFFVRIDATTRELQGEEVVDYCLKRFSKA